ncbi:hypothetical protein A6J04_003700 [Escherichia coli]|nr:hypothetical protein [Escherichia coli]
MRNGVAPYIPAAFCRDAWSAGHGATEAARPERSLQARGFHASDRSDSPKPRQRVRRRLAGAPAAACRSRAWRPDAARQPGAEGAPGRQDNTAVVRIRAGRKRE